MSYIVSDLRAAIRAAIQAIPACANSDLKNVVLPERTFRAAVRPSTIGLSYAATPKRTSGPLGQRDRNELYYQWHMTIVDEELRPSDDSGAILKAEVIAEELRGNPYDVMKPGLRKTRLLKVGADWIYLVFIEERVVPDPYWTPTDGGTEGRVAIDLVWETTTVLV